MSDQIETPRLDKLAAALAAFQSEMPTVVKAHTAQVKSDKGSYSYTYAGLADVTEAAMPILSRHGLSFSTLPGGGVLTGMLLHSSGQSLTASLPISGGTPQAVGSALTYMRRYLLGCMTGLVTDDDDDGQAAQAAPRKAATRPPSPRSAPPQPPALDDEALTERTRGRMFALLGEHGITERSRQLAGMGAIIGHPITSRSEVSEDEGRAIILDLEGRPRPSRDEATS